jgi:predicted porin
MKASGAQRFPALSTRKGHPVNTRLHLICLGALAALGASAAQAQSSVTLYGIVAVEGVYASHVNSGGAVYKLDDSIDTPSRLGFKGTEDLGNGLNAVFGLESHLSPDTGSTGSTFFSRGSYVGLSSTSMGTLTFGRQWGINDDIMGNYFKFDGYSAFAFPEFFYLSDLVDNAVKYVSPEWAGLTVRALVAAGEGATATGCNADACGRQSEIAVTYKYGGFDASASYRYMKSPTGGDPDKLGAVGASILFGDFRPHFGYSEALTPSLGLSKAKAWDVGVSWAAMPQLSLDLDYVNRDIVGSDDDTHFIRGQAQYFLSKRTSLLLNIVSVTNKGAASFAFYGDGTAPLGSEQNVYSFGLRHTF